MSELQLIASRYPDTQHLKQAIVLGYHEFLLDMKSVKVNEFIDPAIFETSVIPEGVPVRNFVAGSNPLALNALLDDSIADLEHDKSLPDSFHWSIKIAVSLVVLGLIAGIIIYGKRHKTNA